MHLIQTVEPYPTDYDAVVDQNHQEQQDGFLPELVSVVENIEQYGTVFIGYPVWGTSLPQPIVSFLNQYELSGKTIIPFCTHAGYGSGGSYAQVQELCPDAEVLDGIAIEAETIDSSETAIDNWLKTIQIRPNENQSLENQVDVYSSEIKITIGNAEITALLNDSAAAQEFRERLQITLSMTRMGEHEYYGALDQPLMHNGRIRCWISVD